MYVKYIMNVFVSILSTFANETAYPYRTVHPASKK